MLSPRATFRLELLDDRIVPATWSVPWDNPAGLTYSFAPDKTDVGGKPNTLFADMKADGYTSPGDWQAVVGAALNTWAVAAGVHFQSVADSGLPFGTLGAVQGDLRFGDIRVASRPLTSNLAAETSPFTWTGTTWAGDIVLNSNVKFSSNGQTGSYDLFSVVLHETGHALGLDGNTDPTSAMCESYATRTGLSAADVTAIQNLYGGPLVPPATASPPDFQTAVSQFFTTLSNAAAATFGNFSGSLLKKSQTDDYVVTAPAAVGSDPMNLIVYVRAKNTSLGLTPQLAVKDAAGHSVPFEVISNTQGWVSVQVRNVTPGASYHLDVFDTALGSGQTLNYGLGVEFNQDPPVQRDLIAANSLSASKTTDSGTLVLNGSRLVSFSLCSTWNGDTSVQMTVTDSTGRVVLQLTSGPNALPPTADLFLDAGTYSVTYKAFSPSGKKVQPVNFVAMMEVLNDPVGIYAPATTTTNTQTIAPPSPPPPTSPPPTTVAPPPDYTYAGTICPSAIFTYLYYY